MRYLHLFMVLLIITSSAVAEDNHVEFPIQIWGYVNNSYREFENADVLIQIDDLFVKSSTEYKSIELDDKRTVPNLIRVNVTPGEHILSVYSSLCTGARINDDGVVVEYVEPCRGSGKGGWSWGDYWRVYYRKRTETIDVPTTISRDDYKYVVRLDEWERPNTNHTLLVRFYDEEREPLEEGFVFGYGTLLGFIGSKLTTVQEKEAVTVLDLGTGLNTGIVAWAPWREAVTLNPSLFATEHGPGYTIVDVFLRSLNITDTNYTLWAFTDTALNPRDLEEAFVTKGDIIERTDERLVWRQPATEGYYLFEDRRDGYLRIDLVNIISANAQNEGSGIRLSDNFNFTSPSLGYKLLLDKLKEHLKDINRVIPIRQGVVFDLATLNGTESTFYDIEVEGDGSFHMDLSRCDPLELLGNTGGSGFSLENVTFSTPSEVYFNLTNYIVQTEHHETQDIETQDIRISTDFEGTSRFLVLCRNPIPPTITEIEAKIRKQSVSPNVTKAPTAFLGLEVTLTDTNFTSLVEQVKKKDILGLEKGRWVHWRNQEYYYRAFLNGTAQVYTKGPLSILTLRKLQDQLDSLVPFIREFGMSQVEPEPPILISNESVRWIEFRTKQDDQYTLKVSNRTAIFDLGIKTVCANDLTIGGLMFCGDHTVLDRVQEGYNRIGLLKADTLTITTLVNASRPMDLSLINEEGSYISDTRHNSARFPSFPIGPLCGDDICSELEERQVPGQPPSPGKIYCCEDCGCPKIIVEREFSDATPMTSEVVNVTTLVKNVGSVPAHNVIFNEVLPPGFLFVQGDKGFSGTIPAKGVTNFTYDMQAPENGGETSYPPLLTLYFDANQNKFLVNASAKRMEVVLTEKDPDIKLSRIIKGEVALLRREIAKEMGETPDVIVLKSLSDLNPAVGDIVRAYVHVTNNLDEDIAITCVEPTSETLEFLDHTARFRDIPGIKEGRTIEYIYEMRAIRTGNFTIDPTRVLLSVGGLNQEFQSNEIKFKVLESKANATTMFGGMNFTLVVKNIGEGDAHNVTVTSAVGSDFFEGKKWGEEYTWNGDLLAGEATSVNLTLTPYSLGSFELPPAKVTYMDQDLKSHKVLANNTDVFYAAPAHFGLFPKIEIIGLLDKNDYNTTEEVNLEAIVFNHGEGTAVDLELNITLSDGLECVEACSGTGSIPAGDLMRVPLQILRTGTEAPLRITLTSRCFDELGYEYVARSFPIDVPLVLPGPEISSFQVEQRYNQVSETLNYNVRSFRPNLTSKMVFMFIPPSEMNFTGDKERILDDGTLILRTFRELGSYTYKGAKNSMTGRIDFPESRTHVFFVDLDGVAHSYVKESKDVLYDAKEVEATPPPVAGPIGLEEAEDTNWLLIAMVGLVSISILGGGVYAVLSGLQSGGTTAEDLEDTEVPDYVSGEGGDEEGEAPGAETIGGGIEGLEGSMPGMGGEGAEGGMPGMGGEGAEGGMPGMGGEGAEGGGWGDQQQGWGPGGAEGGAEGGGWQAPEGAEDDGSGGGGW